MGRRRSTTIAREISSLLPRSAFHTSQAGMSAVPKNSSTTKSTAVSSATTVGTRICRGVIFIARTGVSRI